MTSNKKAARIMVICPSSTPTLKDNIDVANLFRGSPISFRELAKPIPWIRPNMKTSKMRHGFNSVSNRFSTATNKIDKAIIGSTTALGATIMLFMLSANVMECATVKAVACHKITFTLLLSKHRPTTKSMWSNPSGMMCV